MHSYNVLLRWVSSSLLCLMLLQSVQAADPSTPVRYVSGGVGLDERLSLQEQRAEYNFWLKTAAQQSGAYLAGVQARIVDTRNKKVVLEHTLDGPWLMALLPPGRYEVEANWNPGGTTPAQTIRRTTHVQADTLREMVMYFKFTDLADSKD